MQCPKCKNGNIRVIERVGMPDGGDDTHPVVCDACCASYSLELGPNPRYGKDRLEEDDHQLLDSAVRLGSSEEEFKAMIFDLLTVEEYRKKHDAP